MVLHSTVLRDAAPPYFHLSPVVQWPGQSLSLSFEGCLTSQPVRSKLHQGPPMGDPRTAPKENLGCFLAEFVYGQPLTVLGNLLLAATILQVGLQNCSAGVSKQVHLCQSPPPSTTPNIQPSHHTSRRPSLFSSDVMATRLLFNGPMRTPSE